MKKQLVSLYDILLLIFGVIVLICGVTLLVREISYLRELVLRFESRAQLGYGLQTGVISLAIFGAMTALGIITVVVLPLYIVRRNRWFRQESAAREERIRQNRHMAHRQRLETIGMMTSSIAHEFNNLLTPIMSYSMMVLEKLPPEEEEMYDEVLEIYNSSRKAKLLISRLNDLSRKNTENTFRPVSVDEVVRKTLDIANPAKPGEVQVKLDLNCWDQRLQANELQLNQLLLNLILNSFHAMEDKGGTLTLATAFDENQIHISVTDTGCGMEKEVISKIFEPFFTTKEAGKGTGLGLAIAAQVVEDHHGTIQVESRKGKGTCFRVSLPRLADFKSAQ